MSAREECDERRGRKLHLLHVDLTDEMAELCGRYCWRQTPSLPAKPLFGRAAVLRRGERHFDSPTPKLSSAKSCVSSLILSANLFVSGSSLSPGFLASTKGLTRSLSLSASVMMRLRFSSHDFFSSSYAFCFCSAVSFGGLPARADFGVCWVWG